MLIQETQHLHIDPIIVVCGADNNYAIPLAVTLRSVTKNFKSHRTLELFILDGGISDSNKRRILSSLSSNNLTIHFLNPQGMIHGIKPVRHLPLAACYRLLIPKLLPSSFSKAIYLDSDVIVEGNLEDLWRIDMEENYALAVQDTSMPYICNGIKNYLKLHLLPNGKYFNSGVMVLNLEKWRSEEIGEKVITYLQENAASTPCLDQDGLNVVLVGKWKELDFRWNQLPNIYHFSSWSDSSFKRELEKHYENVRNYPFVIHFIGPHKPWKFRCTHPKQNRFIYYLGMTSWFHLLPYFYIQSLVKVSSGRAGGFSIREPLKAA